MKGENENKNESANFYNKYVRDHAHLTMLWRGPCHSIEQQDHRCMQPQ